MSFPILLILLLLTFGSVVSSESIFSDCRTKLNSQIRLFYIGGLNASTFQCCLLNAITNCQVKVCQSMNPNTSATECQPASLANSAVIVKKSCSKAIPSLAESITDDCKEWLFQGLSQEKPDNCHWCLWSMMVVLTAIGLVVGYFNWRTVCAVVRNVRAWF